MPRTLEPQCTTTRWAELFVVDFGLDFVKFDCSYIDFSAHGMLKGAAGMQEIKLFWEAMHRQRTKLSKGREPPVLSLSPGGVREDITRAEYIVEGLPGTMYRTWPDYWGGMPAGQIHVTQQLYNLSIYGANSTWPDWDLLAGVDQLRMTLWAICRSPTMASMKLPASALEVSFLTNPDVLAVHANGTDLRPFDMTHTTHSRILEIIFLRKTIISPHQRNIIFTIFLGVV